MTDVPASEGGDGPSRPPPDCPVTPLGVMGLKMWVLDVHQQMQDFSPRCEKGEMQLIFGGDGWLVKHYPSYPKPSKDNPRPEPNGFDQKEAQAALIGWVSALGVFNPQGKVFGRGAHRPKRNPDQLILHMGNQVLIANGRDKKGKPIPPRTHRAGRIDESFYPAAQKLPPPANEPSTGEEGQALLDYLGRWYWREARASTLLLLGHIGQMFICGALRWRSHVWLTGPTASGKSSLQDLIRTIHDDWCIGTSDASEAAVRQILRDDTLPVLIDEAEADDNPEKQRAILNLAKKSSSGDKIIRGGQDHKAQDFTAQSCFLFSSVLHGQLKGEDRNRLAILDMLPVPADAPPLDIDYAHWRALGRRMHRRMIEQWPRFERTLADYKQAIAQQGFVGRWRDTFGTLLACADLLLYDVAPSAESEANEDYGRERRWVLDVLPMLALGKAEARSDSERVIVHLLAQQIPGAHGHAPETIGYWLWKAMQGHPDTGEVDRAARDRLKSYGLRLVTIAQKQSGWGVSGEPGAGIYRDAYLAVAYGTNQPLNSLFRGSEWHGGAWIQSMIKIEGAVRMATMRFSGESTDNAIAIPIDAVRAKEG